MGRGRRQSNFGPFRLHLLPLVAILCRSSAALVCNPCLQLISEATRSKTTRFWISALITIMKAPVDFGTILSTTAPPVGHFDFRLCHTCPHCSSLLVCRLSSKLLHGFQRNFAQLFWVGRGQRQSTFGLFRLHLLSLVAIMCRSSATLVFSLSTKRLEVGQLGFGFQL